MYAVNNHYWYQMYIDDLPIWGKTILAKISILASLNAKPDIIVTYQIIPLMFIGIVGESENKGESLYMWTHKKFEIGYNDKRVCD